MQHLYGGKDGKGFDNNRRLLKGKLFATENWIQQLQKHTSKEEAAPVVTPKETTGEGGDKKAHDNNQRKVVFVLETNHRVSS